MRRRGNGDGAARKQRWGGGEAASRSDLDEVAMKARRQERQGVVKTGTERVAQSPAQRTTPPADL